MTPELATLSRSYNPEKALFSIHVPRSGGTSLRSALEYWFGSDRVFPHYIDEKNQRLPLRYDIGPLTCVHGHFNKLRGFGISDYYPDADQFVIFIRDPFERHLSVYRYLKNSDAHFHYEGELLGISKLCPSISDFFRLAANPLDYSQLGFVTTLLSYMPMQLTQKNFQDVLETRFVHVGLSEQLGESISILRRKLGFGDPPYVWLNVGAKVQDMDASLRDLHVSMFPFEHEIYGFVRDLHERERAEYVGGR